MKLTILDRFAILSILPTSGSLLQMATTEALRNKLFLNDSEKNNAKIEELPGNKLKFPENFNLNDQNYSSNIEITTGEKILLKDMVKELDEKKEINSDTLHICLRIKDLDQNEKSE